jgi:hypothetical protein
MARPLKIAKSATIDSGFNNPIGNSYSAVGGNISITGQQLLTRVAISVPGIGTISCSNGSANLTGVGTDFSNTLSDGSVVALSDGTVLGYIDDIANATATAATFAANAAVNASGLSFVFADNEEGFVVRQKGKTRYLVTGTTSGLTGQCLTANVANAALAPATMNILGTLANSSTVYLQTVNNHWASGFDGTRYIASFNGAASAPDGTTSAIIDVSSS